MVAPPPAQVERAVSNLLDNAAKWSDSVDVKVAGPEVTVRDHGPGIAEEDLPTSSTASTARRPHATFPGPGLGLRSSGRWRVSHGGSVTAENAVGGGAVFRLRLVA